MAECHSFKVDHRMGVPDRAVREFVTECEKQMGFVRVFMTQVNTPTAILLTVVVVKDEEPDGHSGSAN